MSSSCTELKMELAGCIKSSPCMTRDKRGFHECLKLLASEDPDLRASVSEHCQNLRVAFVACKRGQLDMRLRFRGNKARVSNSNSGTDAAFSSPPSSS